MGEGGEGGGGDVTSPLTPLLKERGTRSEAISLSANEVNIGLRWKTKIKKPSVSFKPAEGFYRLPGLPVVMRHSLMTF